MKFTFLIHPTFPGGKAAILVVMHHTFDKNLTITESRRQVTHPDVRLTVDCLFFEGKLLSCNTNRAARDQIQKWLRVPTNTVITILLDIEVKAI